MRRIGLALVLLFVAGAIGNGDDLQYKAQLLEELVEDVPAILKSFDPETGRFGSGIWICRDQHPMYPLAVAYTTKAEANPYFEDAELLKVIVKSGDPLLENMDERGQWIFAKKDGSTWGKIWMPWTYSRWVRTFQLIEDRMPAEARKRWADALTLGYTGISKTQLKHVHNIPSHHAMGLYIAGKALNQPAWCEQAAAFMMKVMGTQSEAGYWSEGGGPVVLYDFVYVDALGTYYSESEDERILPALEKAAIFHQHFTYPGGQAVETIDQRNPYHDTIEAGNVGFTFTPAGRAYLQNQWTQLGIDRLSSDLIASLLLYGEEGAVAEEASGEGVFALNEGGANRAATLRRGPWFVCMSAYTTPISKSRWIQDRQNFVSIYHDKLGLIVGGGNTKLQPGWSSFTVGDMTLLAHKAGDTSPDFLPKGELYHVPKAARLVSEPLGLELTYGSETCRVQVEVEDDRTVLYQVEASSESELPVIAHVTLPPRMGEMLTTGHGKEFKLGDEPIALSSEDLGGQLTYGGCRFVLPKPASLHWPVLPHNPYRKDGRASAKEGRVEIRIPFGKEQRQYAVRMEAVRSGG